MQKAQLLIKQQLMLFFVLDETVKVHIYNRNVIL